MDLDSLVSVLPKVDAIVIPKVESASHIQGVHKFLTKYDPEQRIKV